MKQLIIILIMLMGCSKATVPVKTSTPKPPVVIQLPEGVKQFGLYYALVYPDSLFVFYHSKADVLIAASDWGNPDKEIVEIKGYAAFALELQVGQQVYFGRTELNNPRANGFYLYGEVPPYKIIEVRDGFIFDITDL